MDRNLELLSFEKTCVEVGLKKIDDYGYEYRFAPGTKTLTFFALIHGNEIGGLEILKRLVSKLIILSPTINLRFLLGNVDAYLADKRFLESDLNRSFKTPDPKTREQKRATKLEEFIKTSDFIIDFHQTIEKIPHPFFIFNYQEMSFDFARNLDSEIPLITYTNFSNLTSGLSITGTASSFQKTAITIETGQKGLDEAQIKYGVDLSVKAIELVESNNLQKVTDWHNCFTWGQTVSNEDFSLELVKTFENFDTVRKNDLIAKNSNQSVFSELDGPVLFPKYGVNRESSKELIRILKPIKALS